MSGHEPHGHADQGDLPVDVSFIGFVLSLAHTAAVHFGDVRDPATGRPGTPNLPAARQIISILALLGEKTRGNLTAEERQLLEQLVEELRLREAGAGAPGSPEPRRVIIP